MNISFRNSLVLSAALSFLSIAERPFGQEPAISAPSDYPIEGSWEGTVRAGKFQIRMIIHLQQQDDGTVEATMDYPDMARKGMPIHGVLYNHPHLLIETGSFTGTFKGQVNDEFTEFTGRFESQGGFGPRPGSIVFRRATETEEVKPELDYVFDPANPDIRGYWRGC